MQPGSRIVSLVFHGLLLSVVLCVTLVLVEGMLRLRYVEPARAASPEIEAIQPHLRLAPEIGFAWRPNVDADDNIVFDVRDVLFDPLSTDGNGFINAPQAIEHAVKAGDVEVVGLGDSFMEHAARILYATFREAQLSYYSLAIHRQCPPQYTSILKNYALPLRPNWIVYGLFENDFLETEDFDRWRGSGLDWFSYHGGTWCGAPVETSRLARAYKDRLRGIDGLVGVIRSRLRGEGMSVAGPSPETVRRVSDSIAEAFRLANEDGISFLLVLIPARGTSTLGTSPESEAYDQVVAHLEELHVPVLDLRKAFIADPDPASLYYREDAHWNARGMQKAADAILEVIEGRDPGDDHSKGPGPGATRDG